MWTRRELVLSLGALAGAPLAGATALPAPPPGRGGLKIGLVQSAVPFVDPGDTSGSSRRAIGALTVLVERSAAVHGPLDWLACGALPLSGPGPFPPALLDALALQPGCAALAALTDLARRHRLRLSLGAFWRSAAGIEPRLILVEADGRVAATRGRPPRLGDGPTVELEPDPCLSDAALAALCRQRGSWGARIDAAAWPPTPPGARAALGGRTRLVAPDGRVVARASTDGETCVVAELAA